MTVLLLAEQENGSLTKTTLQVLSATSCIRPLEDIELCFCEDLLAEDLARQLLNLVQSRTDNQAYTHIIAPANSLGKNVLARLSGLLDIAMISDVIAIQDDHIFRRPIYAGNAIQTVSSAERIKILTVRPSAFPIFSLDQHTVLKKQYLPAFLTNHPEKYTKTRLINITPINLKRPALSQAKIVVAGGRGLGSAENFTLLESLADCLHAAVGASRSAVEAGFISNDYQIGQTGKIIAPDIYIAIGISGAIQHTAGIKDSKTIIAINKDPQAPIFDIADYGLVGDLFQIIPEWIKLLNQKT